MTAVDRETAALVRAGFEALPTQTAILDATGVIVYTNPAWRAFAEANGMERSPDCIGENYLVVSAASDDNDAAVATEGIRAVLAGDRDRFEMEYPCHSPDERRWFTMRAVAFSHQDDRFVLVMHLDITDRTLAEQRVAAHNDRLEILAGVLSHDIRNPLTVAKGRADLLAEEGESVHLDPIRQSLERIQAIIDDALVLARKTSVDETEAVDLATAARLAWGHVETESARLEVVETATIDADPNLLGHLFENLFRNAIEHAGEESTVRVTACEGGFSVEDDGPGIPPDDRRDVFEVGYSTDDTGTGLGLSIVSRVVEAHGWSVEVGASSTGGARFRVRTAKGR